MKHHLTLPLSAFLMMATMTVSAFAQTIDLSGRLQFDSSHLDRYSDAPFLDARTNLAVSVLTSENILQGNDDGTFGAERNLNRAEFVQIVMRLFADTGPVNRNCFPDIAPSSWYADPVCRAKALGIVRGNARIGVDASLWRFEPTRDVQYEEAVKMLVQVYALPVHGDSEGADWYVPYLEKASQMGLSLPGLSPGDRITRGEMARLTVAFLAESYGQLADLRQSEAGSSSSRSSRSSLASSVSSPSSRMSSSMSSTSRDPLLDLSVRSNFVVLGETTPVLGAVDFFAASEPIDVRTIRVRFASDPSSIQQVRIYAEEDGRLLGMAFRNGSGDYEVSIPAGTFLLPHRIEKGVYVRALLKPADGGAVGGQIVRIDQIEVEGEGTASDSHYTVASTETFLSFETTPAVITVFRSTGSVTSLAFTQGSDVILGDFDVKARSTDNDFAVVITSLTFRLAASSDVHVSNVELMVPGAGVSSPCSVSAGSIVCGGIPASVGVIDTEQRLRLVGDVSLDAGALNPFLQVTLQAAGSATSPGDIVWTDGHTTYDWIAVDEPVARGIRYE